VELGKVALLLTGLPGVGKTTVIKRALEGFPGQAGGFYTEEVREGHRRMGFDIVTLSGERAPLARWGMASRHCVGGYGVDTEALDRVGVAAIDAALRQCQVVVVDEVGKMELFSTAFREVVLRVVEAGKPFLGTVTFRPHPWADRLKADPRVRVQQVTPDNRDALVATVRRWLESCVRLHTKTLKSRTATP
jgi:nucleoside-triphosphatase